MLFVFASRLKRRTRNPSPLLVSYRADYLIGMLTDGGILIAFALATVLVGLGEPAVGDRIDPAVALVIAFYMLVGRACRWCATTSAPSWTCRSPKSEQLTITRVLAHHYADYDLVGTLYTRSSGTRRFVEIELGFDGEKSVEHVHVLSRHMEQALAAELPGLHFRIVPVWEPDA